MLFNKGNRLEYKNQHSGTISLSSYYFFRSMIIFHFFQIKLLDCNSIICAVSLSLFAIIFALFLLLFSSWVLPSLSCTERCLSHACPQETGCAKQAAEAAASTGLATGCSSGRPPICYSLHPHSRQAEASRGLYHRPAQAVADGYADTRHTPWSSTPLLCAGRSLGKHH